MMSKTFSQPIQPVPELIEKKAEMSKTGSAGMSQQSS
jgi:hypothetical protein